MKFLNLRSVLITFLLSTTTAMAAAPTLLLNFRYGNQITASSLAISSTGAVVRIERVQANIQTINENPLSGAELANLKALVAKALKGKIVKKTISASMGSQSGTISTQVGTSKKDLEGIVRSPTELDKKATQLTNLSPAMKSIKAIVNKYVNVKMP